MILWFRFHIILKCVRLNDHRSPRTPNNWNIELLLFEMFRLNFKCDFHVVGFFVSFVVVVGTNEIAFVK